MSRQAHLFFGEREALDLLWESLPEQDRGRATTLYASLIARGVRTVTATSRRTPTMTGQCSPPPPSCLGRHGNEMTSPAVPQTRVKRAGNEEGCVGPTTDAAEISVVSPITCTDDNGRTSA